MDIATALGATNQEKYEAAKLEVAMLKREIAVQYRYDRTARAAMLHLAQCMRQLERAEEYAEAMSKLVQQEQ